MSVARRSLKIAKKVFLDWQTFFNEEMLQTSTVCPDFEEHMKTFVSEMMFYTNLNSVYSYTEQILNLHGIEDSVGGAYWYLKNHFIHVKPNYLPHSLNKHWVLGHHRYMQHKYVKDMLLLEKEHLTDIAKWTEIQFIGSQERALKRKIDARLDLLD